MWITRMAALPMMALIALTVPLHAMAADPKPSQLVTAFGNLGTECAPGADSKAITLRQNGDGSTSTFTIPNRQVFVVTSYDFEFIGATPSRSTRALLAVIDGAATQVSVASAGSTLADSVGSGGGTVLIPSGFAVKAGNRLCFTVTPATAAGMWVHGYFAPDK